MFRNYVEYYEIANQKVIVKKDIRIIPYSTLNWKTHHCLVNSDDERRKVFRNIEII